MSLKASMNCKRPCMKQLHLILAVAVLIVAGCSSTPTKIDRGPVRAATFSFVDPGIKLAPGSPDKQEQAHLMIQESITRNLASKGVNRAPSGGDVIVAYLIVVGDNTGTRAVTTFFGGRDSTELYEKAHQAYTTSKNPNHFEAGTLLIDVLDGKTYEVLKRSHVVRPLLSNPSAEIRAERIQEAVDAALIDLRILR
jgi:hypothetical protein